MTRDQALVLTIARILKRRISDGFRETVDAGLGDNELLEPHVFGAALAMASSEFLFEHGVTDKSWELAEDAAEAASATSLGVQ